MDADALTVKQLEAWVRSGGQWRVVDISNAHVEVELCACTGERLEIAGSDDPTVIGYLRTAEPSWAFDDTQAR
ncbi:MAG: hypothetical protein ACRDNJ_08795 [Solirubrobacteraceae bacterium]